VGSKAGSVLDFGGGVTANIVTSVSSPRADLFWSDPLGASSNDYDLFVTNVGGAVVGSSTNIQSGTQDPYESVATDVHNSPSPNFFVGGGTNPAETFSSDGPRRTFFLPNGTAITPGNISS